MLEKIRKPSRAKNLFAYIIFGLICLVFVFFGVPIGSISGSGYVALVNKKVISIAEFKQNLKNEDSLGSPGEERQKETKRLILNQLINREIVFQSAQELGLNVSDNELRSQITSSPFFQEEGKFKNALYQSYLQYQRILPKTFEDRIRKSVLSARVEKLFHWAMGVSELEKERNEQMNQMQFQLKFVRISLADSHSSEEIKKWQKLLSSPRNLNKALKSQGFQWIETPVVSLKNWTYVLPEIADADELFENIFEKIPHPGLIPKLMLEGENVIIVRLEKFEIKESAEQPQNVLSLSIARAASFSWFESQRNKSKVKINHRFL